MPGNDLANGRLSATRRPMNDADPANAHAKIISAFCLFVVGYILVAGLWPFHIPGNGVSWLKDENGLRFGGHGSAVTVGGFRPVRSPYDTGYSLEICMTPARTTRGAGTILAFDSSPNPRAPFKLAQYGTSLALQRYSIDERGQVHLFWFKVVHVFDAEKPVFVTITSHRDGTDLYVNGMLAGRSTDPGIASRELAGRLVLANSTVDDSWKGRIAVLAIYDKQLTPAEVSSHFLGWIANRDLSPTKGSLVALYRFDERAGNAVHNQVDATTDLTIPNHYFVLHPALLRWDLPEALSHWKGWRSWEDLATNVGGFVPFGFVFATYFSSVKRIARPALVVVLMGFFLSLTIEVSQRFLPNRDSGISDLITNTTGTALGILLHQSSPLRALWKGILDHSTLIVGIPDAMRSPQDTSAREDEKVTFSR